jgi:hypothetical protein
MDEKFSKNRFGAGKLAGFWRMGRRTHPVVAWGASSAHLCPQSKLRVAAFAYSVSFAAVCFVPVWVLYRKWISVKA